MRSFRIRFGHLGLIFFFFVLAVFVFLLVFCKKRIIVCPEGILVVSSIQLLATDYDALLGTLMKNLVILMCKRLYIEYKLTVATT